jgi:quinol monooxygenase YgiN
MEALMAHFETPHMDEFMRELPHVVAGEIQTRRFAVQTVDDERETSAVAPPRVIH